jgi:hypothetical protein
MDEYTLVNQFTERFRTEVRRRVRSKEEQFLEEYNFVLKKKRECERRITLWKKLEGLK